MNTSWDRQADWYHNLLTQNPNSYQEKVIKPNLMRLMAIKPGERILDLACGNGFFSAVFAEAGAEVMGIDISPKLIGMAKKKYSRPTDPQAKINFQVGSVLRLPAIADKSNDQIACIMAIQNIENVKGLLTEAKRVLKPGGKFHIVMSHPIFRVPRQSSWEWDLPPHLKRCGGGKNKSSHPGCPGCGGKVQYRRIDRYLSESKIAIQMHPGLIRRSSQEAKAADTTTTFHRPLQYYFKLFKNAGFAVANLEEWISDRESEPGSRATAENRARQEIPLFLYIQAVPIIFTQ